MEARAGRGVTTPMKTSTPKKTADVSTSRDSPRSPADGKFSVESANLSARLGGLVLAEK